MITFYMFIDNLKKIDNEPNKKQLEIIEPGADTSFFIVAGPGSGKTAVLTARILKLIFVDGVDPSGILATTFTRKAAGELRSRILGRGFALQDLLLKDKNLKKEEKEWIEGLDINQLITGTIDGICEEVLRGYREPGTLPPVLVDEFVFNTVLLREGLFKKGRYRNDDLYHFIAQLKGSKWGINIGTKVETLKEIWARRYNDQVNWRKFVDDGASEGNIALQVIDEALEDYKCAMESRNMMDFTMLEQQVLEKLKQGKLSEFTDGLRVIMVDEYQDTNLLQESIYFELVKNSGASLMVVGDDDQSLFRFRGTAVELFVEFPDRFKERFGISPEIVFLTTNYRSTKNIIDFVNC